MGEVTLYVYPGNRQHIAALERDFESILRVRQRLEQENQVLSYERGTPVPHTEHCGARILEEENWERKIRSAVECTGCKPHDGVKRLSCTPL